MDTTSVEALAHSVASYAAILVRHGVSAEGATSLATAYQAAIIAANAPGQFVARPKPARDGECRGSYDASPITINGDPATFGEAVREAVREAVKLDRDIIGRD